MADFPALQGEFFDFELANKLPDRAPPRILILYGCCASALSAASPRKKPDDC